MISPELYDLIDNLPERVSKKAFLANKLAKEYESEKQIEDALLSDSALLYCLGNQFVSERILDKPGKLTETEFKCIRLIPFLSYQMIKEEDVDDDVKLMCLYYKENNPTHIAGYDLPDISDVVEKRKKELYTIDSYIGMTSRRAYRDPLPVGKAIKILEEDNNTSNDVLAYIKATFLY